MNRDQIRAFLSSYQEIKDRTIVIVDFSNVEKWKNSLGWDIGIQELASLIKHFSYGNQSLRRFYYGSDYGPSEKNSRLTGWSKMILNKARNNRLEIITKRVKYIKNAGNDIKKCDLDVEMAVDLIKLKDTYDQAIIFSGDGDLTYVMKYLNEIEGKTFIVFGARDHISKEVIDYSKTDVITRILFAEDFDYRLRMKNR